MSEVPLCALLGTERLAAGQLGVEGSECGALVARAAVVDHGAVRLHLSDHPPSHQDQSHAFQAFQGQSEV